MGGILSGIISAVSHPVRSAQQMNNGIVGGAHWLFPHDPFAHPGSQAAQIGHELASSFDPRSRAGFLNLASLFVGGPKDGGLPPTTEEVLQRWQPAGEFHAYGRLKGGEHVTGSPLDRGVVHEGPIRQGKGYNPSMQKMVERAHTNPFVKASTEKTAEAKARISALDQARVQAVRKMAERQKVDQKIGAAPMAGKVGQRYPEHDAALLHGPSFINHPAFLKGLLQRRYIAGIGHNHLN